MNIALEGLFAIPGKVAVVTGASRGLGKAMALALAEAGAKVAITARRQSWLGQASAEFQAAGHDCLAVTCDVSDQEQVQAFVAQVLERYRRIDVLVNNAGISWAAPSAGMPLQKWRDVLDVNATGTFIVTQAVACHMIERARRIRASDANESGGESEPNTVAPAAAGLATERVPAAAGCVGKIVNVVSIMGLRGLPPDLLSAAGYSASKGAVVALTRSLAVEWANYGVTVNAVAPGFFPTRLSEGVITQHEAALLARIPLGRFGSERDIGGMIVFLASPASDYLTGQVLSLDGGATAL